MHEYLVETKSTSASISTQPAPTDVFIELDISSTMSTEQSVATQVIEVITPGPQGPPGPAGTGGGSSGAGFTYRQASAAATWIVAHNLNRWPDVVLLLDSDPLNRVWTDVHYIDGNTVSIEFPSPVTGWAYI